LKREKGIVLTAVTQNGNALHFADQSLQRDRVVVLAALKKSS